MKNLAITVVFIVMLASAGFSQVKTNATGNTPSESVESVFVAKDDGDGKVGEIVETFDTNDIPIHCVVMLKRSDPVEVKMNLVALEVRGVKPETKVVTAGYKTKQGENRVNFSGRPDGKWIAGTYRIDIFVAGKRESTLTFEMRPAGSPVGANSFAPASSKRRPRKKHDL